MSFQLPHFSLGRRVNEMIFDGWNKQPVGEKAVDADKLMNTA